MSGYEISCSITALCPCCGKELPPNSYMTWGRPIGHPLERDNPHERTDRRVFITPCTECFEPKKKDKACPTCNGAGLVGGHRGQTPENYEESAEPCPDCSKGGAA